MSRIVFETLYGIDVIGVSFTRNPHVSVLTYDSDAIRYELKFYAAHFPDALMESLYGYCCQIRINNEKQETQNDFGCYRVQLHGEDGCFAEFHVDRFEDSAVDTVPQE